MNEELKKHAKLDKKFCYEKYYCMKRLILVIRMFTSSILKAPILVNNEQLWRCKSPLLHGYKQQQQPQKMDLLDDNNSGSHARVKLAETVAVHPRLQHLDLCHWQMLGECLAHKHKSEWSLEVDWSICWIQTELLYS